MMSYGRSLGGAGKAHGARRIGFATVDAVPLSVDHACRLGPSARHMRADDIGSRMHMDDGVPCVRSFGRWDRQLVSPRKCTPTLRLNQGGYRRRPVPDGDGSRYISLWSPIEPFPASFVLGSNKLHNRPTLCWLTAGTAAGVPGTALRIDRGSKRSGPCATTCCPIHVSCIFSADCTMESLILDKLGSVVVP